MEDAFAVLGTGRLGRALARALAADGARVTGWNRSPAGLARFREAAPGAVAAPSAATAVGAAGTVVLAVSDDALPALAAELARAAAGWTGRTVIHCSGRAGTGPLRPLAERGAVAVAAHPVMAFAGEARADAARMAGIGWGVTADDADGLSRGVAFAERLGGRPFELEARRRDLYHAALTHAINHLATVTVQGVELLERAGAADPAAVLRPAMEAALANALARGPAAATGPVVRGDAGTVAAHVGALASDAPGVLPAYAALTRAGIDLARRTGRITEGQAERLRDALPPG